MEIGHNIIICGLGLQWAYKSTKNLLIVSRSCTFGCIPKFGNGFQTHITFLLPTTYSRTHRFFLKIPKYLISRLGVIHIHIPYTDQLFLINK
jgi:hypothetical protein